jgi:ATP-binding cassette subfamily B protein
VFELVRGRNQWRFFGSLVNADRRLATAWWVVLLLRRILPALFAIVAGILVGAVQLGEDLVAPLVVLAAFPGAASALTEPPGHRSQLGKPDCRVAVRSANLGVHPTPGDGSSREPEARE